VISGGALDLREASRGMMPRIAYDPALAPAGRRTWSARMLNEYGSSVVFASLAEQLARAGFDAEEVAACREFAEEEKRHGILCGAVVEALGGAARETLPDRPDFPLHDDVAPLEGVLRNLLSVSCLSETVAVALIGAERLEMPEGELRELLTSIYADEVGHARFGWKVVSERVPALDAAARSRLSRYLRVAFGHLEEHELRHLPVGCSFPPEGAALGLCDGSDARVLFYETVNEVIVPQLEALGLSADDAWRRRHVAG
jgi:hypothetical protein